MKKALETASTVAVIVAALAVAVVVVRREFFPVKVKAGMQNGIEATEVKGWRALSQYGVWMGDSTARVVLTEFGDYECPYCRSFHKRLMAVQDSLTEPIGVLYIHLPLSIHRFAKAAANAATCAQEAGHFEPFHSLLYAKQDSIGLKSWASYAAEAGIGDTVAFNACARQPGDRLIVAQGVHISDSLGVTSTPTVMINQWKYAMAPVDSLRVILQAALDKTGR